ncbi:hypothetical protein EVAR_69168_1 [Eumeta japonica]|uniref:Uncharacterized protein n=1 Tax=Eumeta variegata TaxID=151549 RepID=A0A4C1ZFB9_EUMVA|nr:hypothetical protein EVAR_69168_1 [Eumeta japonica]
MTERSRDRWGRRSRQLPSPNSFLHTHVHNDTRRRRCARVSPSRSLAATLNGRQKKKREETRSHVGIASITGTARSQHPGRVRGGLYRNALFEWPLSRRASSAHRPTTARPESHRGPIRTTLGNRTRTSTAFWHRAGGPAHSHLPPPVTKLP